MTRYLATFVIVLAALFGIELLQPVQRLLVEPWTALLARWCAALVTTFDAQASSSGKLLFSPANGFAVSIEAGCNGVEASLVLVAAMAAFPATWRARLVGMAAGIVAVQAVNVVRVISLFYLGQWRTDVFQFAHEYLWQGLIMIDVLIVWLLWMRLVAPRPAATPSA